MVCAVLFAFHLAGNSADVVEGHQNEVAAGDAQVRGDERALVADGVANDLDEDLLAAFEDPIDTGVFGVAVLFAVVGAGNDVVGAQEAVLLDAEIDKGGVEGWLEVGDDSRDRYCRGRGRSRWPKPRSCRGWCR